MTGLTAGTQCVAHLHAGIVPYKFIGRAHRLVLHHPTESLQYLYIVFQYPYTVLTASLHSLPKTLLPYNTLPSHYTDPWQQITISTLVYFCLFSCLLFNSRSINLFVPDSLDSHSNIFLFS